VTTEPDRLDDDRDFFLAHLDPQPERVHRRGVWADSDGAGSRLGSPAAIPAYASWLNSPDRSADSGHPDEYRWPARAAIAKLAHEPVRAGFPDRSLTLRAIARCGGDLSAAADLLAGKWPAMGDPESARAHCAKALHRFRAIYRPERLRPAPPAEVAA
jgi:hypothetical protein